MTGHKIEIAPIRVWDLFTITRMTHENMLGADREYTRLVSRKSWPWSHYLSLGINLLFAETGFKAISEGEIAACAYLNMRRRSGYVFNVSVLRSFRRQGIGSLMMEHLEEVAGRKGCRWMTLQVDDSNNNARKLYESLGYRAYHPQYFVGTAGTENKTEGDGDISVGKLSSGQGRQLFAHYLEIERAEGDSWAASIARELVPEPATAGSYYRCLVKQEEVGCIQSNRQGRSIRIKWALDPSQWTSCIVMKVIGSVLEAAGEIKMPVEIHLGSSKHHETLAQLLSEHGFMERTRSRFYMLKRIEL
ncbi:MAG TPA: GNAT family N-acetyltransferase [candidate division Zixibacteria bacterium]|nr:GNAT family N-acetyltransferase [candidate division Zixibacteria bacterium]